MSSNQRSERLGGRTRRDKLRDERWLFRRDGPVKYLKLLYRLRRFHRAVDRMRGEDEAVDRLTAPYFGGRIPRNDPRPGHDHRPEG